MYLLVRLEAKGDFKQDTSLTKKKNSYDAIKKTVIMVNSYSENSDVIGHQKKKYSTSGCK